MCVIRRIYTSNYTFEKTYPNMFHFAVLMLAAIGLVGAIGEFGRV